MITGDYTNAHKALDFSGRGDDGIYACLSGTIEQSVNLYVNSWLSVPPLTTRDYGNFIKIKHADGTSSLYAHLKKDSLLPVGSKVKEGQRIATVGNTGNSTGAHLHFEFRNVSNLNIEPRFEKESMSTITIEQKVFEELVTKSSGFDEFNRIGFSSAAQVEQLIRDHKTEIENKNAEVAGYKSAAEEARKSLNELIVACSKALNTVQEIEQIKATLTKVDADLDALDSLQRQYAELQLHSKEQEENLRKEIAVLKALLEHSDQLAGASLKQIIREIVRRLRNYLGV